MAPIAGRVSRYNVTVGNFVNGGAGQPTLLTTIVSVDPMYCYITVPELSYLKYRKSEVDYKHTNVRDLKIRCLIELENETSFAHEGLIDFVDNSVDPNTGTIQARGVIPNPSGSLRPGLFARMRVTPGAPYEALLVPDSAIGTTQNERFLLIVGKDNLVELRPVKLGTLFGSLRAIADGLKPNERVIINGLVQTRPGTKVNAQEAEIPPEVVKAAEVVIASAMLPSSTIQTKP